MNFVFACYARAYVRDSSAPEQEDCRDRAPARPVAGIERVRIILGLLLHQLARHELARIYVVSYALPGFSGPSVAFAGDPRKFLTKVVISSGALV